LNSPKRVTEKQNEGNALVHGVGGGERVLKRLYIKGRKMGQGPTGDGWLVSGESEKRGGVKTGVKNYPGRGLRGGSGKERTKTGLPNKATGQ